MTADWSHWGRSRPPTQLVHLDSAAAGRTSYAVQRAIAEHLRRESQVGAYVAAAQAAPAIEAGRADLAALLGVPVAGLAFVESASAGLAALLAAWPLPAEATIGVAASEWGPNLRAFRDRGLGVRLLPVDSAGRMDVPGLAALLAADPPTVVHVLAAAAHRGLVQPLAEILRVARAAGVPVWVDAAQGLGQVDVAAGVDAVYGTSRKWLCGPRGVGLLGVAEEWWGRLRVSPSPLEPEAGPVARLESGDANIAGRVGLAVAVAEHVAAGPAAVRRRLASVGELARAELASAPGWRIVPAVAPSGASVALRPVAGQDVFAERQRLLESHRVLVTASSPARAPGEDVGPTLRVSPHVDATAGDFRRLAAALG